MDWAYNGKTAWKSVNERWKNETEQWVGSNYLCYRCVKNLKTIHLVILPMKNNILQIQRI